jgi:hypothetical protein
MLKFWANMKNFSIRFSNIAGNKIRIATTPEGLAKLNLLRPGIIADAV